MARVLTLANRKGGCGKSTFAVSLAAVGVSRAFQIGTVDLDSQANASKWSLRADTVRALTRERTSAMLEYPPRRNWLPLGHPLAAHNVTESEAVEYVLAHCIHRSESVPGLEVIPATPSVHSDDAERLLLRELPHDWLVVDTPADTSTPATRSALAQSDVVVAPVRADDFSIWALELLVREIESVGRRDLLENGGLRIVINGRAKWSVQDAAEHEIRERYGALVLSECVPQSVRVAEASMAPELLKKSNPIWKAAELIWSGIVPAKKRGRAA